MGIAALNPSYESGKAWVWVHERRGPNGSGSFLRVQYHTWGGPAYDAGRVVVCTQHRNGQLASGRLRIGVGARLLAQEDCCGTLAPNADAIRFYRRMGFEFVQARDFGADHCHMHRLSRERYLQSLAHTLAAQPESET